jgi:hypothetical protein
VPWWNIEAVGIYRMHELYVACPLVLLAASSVQIGCVGLSPAFPRRQEGKLTAPAGMGAGASF